VCWSDAYEWAAQYTFEEARTSSQNRWLLAVINLNVRPKGY
jgi:hypothetical protein